MSDARALGVDVGGTKILGVATDDAGRVHAEVRRPTPVRGSGLVECVIEVLDELGADRARRGQPIGVGLPGLVDATGVLRFSPHLPTAVDVDLRDRWPPEWPGPHVVNDATAAASAEGRLGAGRDLADFLFVALGTGIGGALVRHGVVDGGPRGYAGEYGHMVVVPGGEPCPCGGRGCWERYASASGLVSAARRAGDVAAHEAPAVVARARAGESAALAALDEFARWLALGVANLVVALDVGDVVLGGGLSAAAPAFLGTAAAELERTLEGARARPPTRWRVAALGERAGALGAALGAMETS